MKGYRTRKKSVFPSVLAVLPAPSCLCLPAPGLASMALLDIGIDYPTMKVILGGQADRGRHDQRPKRRHDFHAPFSQERKIFFKNLRTNEEMGLSARQRAEGKRQVRGASFFQLSTKLRKSFDEIGIKRCTASTYEDLGNLLHWYGIMPVRPRRPKCIRYHVRNRNHLTYDILFPFALDAGHRCRRISCDVRKRQETAILEYICLFHQVESALDSMRFHRLSLVGCKRPRF